MTYNFTVNESILNKSIEQNLLNIFNGSFLDIFSNLEEAYGIMSVFMVALFLASFFFLMRKTNDATLSLFISSLTCFGIGLLFVFSGILSWYLPTLFLLVSVVLAIYRKTQIESSEQ